MNWGPRRFVKQMFKTGEKKKKRSNGRLFPQKRLETVVHRALGRCTARPCFYTKQIEGYHLVAILHVAFLFIAISPLQVCLCSRRIDVYTVYARSFFFVTSSELMRPLFLVYMYVLHCHVNLGNHVLESATSSINVVRDVRILSDLLMAIIQLTLSIYSLRTNDRASLQTEMRTSVVTPLIVSTFKFVFSSSGPVHSFLRQDYVNTKSLFSNPSIM